MSAVGAAESIPANTSSRVALATLVDLVFARDFMFRVELRALVRDREHDLDVDLARLRCFDRLDDNRFLLTPEVNLAVRIDLPLTVMSFKADEEKPDGIFLGIRSEATRMIGKK